MRYIIFLGAGASAAEGAPIQRDLFKAYFAAHRRPADQTPVDALVATFFRSVFNIDVFGPLSGAPLPTFEEVLGLIDIATNRREALDNLPIEAHEQGNPSLSSTRRGLVLVMAQAVKMGVVATRGLHRRLISTLRDTGKLQRAVFITTNYDTLIDEAIYDCATAPGSVAAGDTIDYGFEGIVPGSIHASTGGFSHPLLKIHGSLNWLHCPVCTDLVVSSGPDIVSRLISDPESALCTRCDNMREAVIVPPTYYKDLSNVYVAVVWNRAARALREASHVVFCGYSMPDADMHIRYLVKTGQMNRRTTDDVLRITLVNNYPGKTTVERDHELERYRRFFGGEVSDPGLSFEDFVDDPERVIGRLAP